MNFSYDRPAGLTCMRKLVFTEDHSGHFSSLVLG
jgi:hypothetical protein